MTGLFFSAGNIEAEHLVESIFNDLDLEIEIHRSLNLLSKRFHNPREGLDVLIFLAPSHEILLDLLLIHNQMYDLPIILILPDSKRKTILKGHELYPRFITFMDDDLSDLAQFLYEMNNREKRPFFKKNCSNSTKLQNDYSRI